MKLVKGSSVYNFPEYTSFESDTDARCDKSEKAFSHGEIMTGDGKIEGRDVTVEAEILDCVSKSEYRAAIDALKQAAYRQDQKLYLDDDRHINIKNLKKISEEFYDGFYRVRAKIKVTFYCPDPFFYNETLSSQEITITESPQIFTVSNGGNLDTPPIITIEPSETNSVLSLVNTTDNSRTFSYSDASFSAGNSLVIDSTDGTVEKDGTNTLNNVGGTFLTLLAGNNEITYTGPLGTITFNYTKRWL